MERPEDISGGIKFLEYTFMEQFQIFDLLKTWTSCFVPLSEVLPLSWTVKIKKEDGILKTVLIDMDDADKKRREKVQLWEAAY